MEWWICHGERLSGINELRCLQDMNLFWLEVLSCRIELAAHCSDSDIVGTHPIANHPTHLSDQLELELALTYDNKLTNLHFQMEFSNGTDQVPAD